MPKDVKFNIKLNIDGKDQIVTASTNSKELAKNLDIVRDRASSAGAGFTQFIQASVGLQQLSSGIQQLTNTLSSLIAVNTANVEAETKLAANMRNSMAARDEDIESIRELTAAQQQLGVISQGVQTAGAQELAKYLDERASLEALIPVMNDMLVQQYGLNVTSEEAASIAQRLGKVMNGQTSTLTRYGYTFTEAQEQILKFGTEEQRAATLAEIVSASVGGMNAELAKTDAGRAKQVSMAIDDIRANAGAAIARLEPMIKVLNSVGQGVTGLGRGVISIQALTKAFASMRTAIAAASTAMKVMMGLSIVGVLTAVAAAIIHITSSARNAKGAIDETRASFEGLKAASDAYSDAAANATVEIDTEIRKLQQLQASNANASEEIKKLNSQYGDIFGCHQTESDWLTTLTNKRAAYAKMIGYEAEMREIAIQKAKAEISLQQAQQKKEAIEQAENTTEQSVSGSIYAATTGNGTLYSKVTFQETTEYKNVQKEVAKYMEEVEDFNNRLTIIQDAIESAADELGQPTATGARSAGGTSGAVSTVTAAPYVEPEEKQTLQDYDDALQHYSKLRLTANRDEIAAIDEKIAALKEERAAFEGVETTTPSPGPVEELQTIGELTDAIQYYRDLQQSQAAEEAVSTQSIINELQNVLDFRQALLDELPPLKEKLEEIQQLTGEDYEIEVKTLGGEKIQEIIDRLKELSAQAQQTGTDVGDVLSDLTDGWSSVGDTVSDTGDETDDAGEKTLSAADKFAAAKKSIESIESAVRSFSGAVDDSTQAWMEYGLGVIDAVMKAIPAIMNLVTAQDEEATANTVVAATGAAASVASIPIVGWVMALTAIAAIVGAVMSLPKFAEGGIAYGPTIGMFGEYSSAATNPEVVAPLDRLRSLIQPAGMAGDVEFRIRGRQLVGILQRENNLRARS